MPIILAGLLALVVAVTFWSVVLVILALWVSYRLLRMLIPQVIAWQAARPPRVPKPPKPPKALPRATRPAPGYVPRWTFTRRMEDAREHAQWEAEFESLWR